MKSIVLNPKNRRLHSAFGGLLLVVALVLVACWSTQTGSSTPTPASHTPGTKVCTYKGHSDVVSELAWSPDGKYIASGGPDHTLQVWEAMTGKHIRSINVLLNVKSDYGGMTFAWSPDSKYLVAGFSDNTAKVVNVMTGEFTLTYTGHTASVNQVAWSPDGKYIASASSDKTIQVWDAMTGKLRLTYTGHADAAWPLAWSPDGKYIASGSWDGTTQVWDAMTGTRIHTFEGISVFAWSPDGKYIALGSIGKAGERYGDSDAHVVDATTWSTMLTYTGHAQSYIKDGFFIAQNVMAVVWSPDGTYIASGSSDKTVQVWIAP
jgi:WD40 repeat protein